MLEMYPHSLLPSDKRAVLVRIKNSPRVSLTAGKPERLFYQADVRYFLGARFQHLSGTTFGRVAYIRTQWVNTSYPMN